MTCKTGIYISTNWNDDEDAVKKLYEYNKEKELITEALLNLSVIKQ